MKFFSIYPYEKLIIFICLIPSLTLAQSDFRHMVLTNYVEAGHVFYTNEVVGRYALISNKLVVATNLIGKYKYSLVRNAMLFKTDSEEVWVSLTITKDYRRYGNKEAIMAITNGFDFINDIKVFKYLEVETLTMGKFMEYWMYNKNWIKERRGDILRK